MVTPCEHPSSKATSASLTHSCCECKPGLDASCVSPDPLQSSPSVVEHLIAYRVLGNTVWEPLCCTLVKRCWRESFRAAVAWPSGEVPGVACRTHQPPAGNAFFASFSPLYILLSCMSYQMLIPQELGVQNRKGQMRTLRGPIQICCLGCSHLPVRPFPRVHDAGCLPAVGSGNLAHSPKGK